MKTHNPNNPTLDTPSLPLVLVLTDIVDGFTLWRRTEVSSFNSTPALRSSSETLTITSLVFRASLFIFFTSKLRDSRPLFLTHTSPPHLYMSSLRFS